MVLVAVNYHCDEEMLRLARQALGCAAPVPLRILIVENSPIPAESALAKLAQTDSRCIILGAGRNRGYFGGAAFALEQYRASFARWGHADSLPEWFILSNPDIDLASQNIFQKLSELYGRTQPPVLAPSVLGLTGADENPFMERRPATGRMHAYKWLYRYSWSARAYEWLSHLRHGRWSAIQGPYLAPPSGPRPVYAAHGAFLVFHRSYFESGGTLDFGAFLFGEEIFVAETVRRIGGAVVYDPRLQVRHIRRRTTDLSRNPELYRYLRQSTEYVADEFFAGAGTMRHKQG